MWYQRYERLYRYFSKPRTPEEAIRKIHELLDENHLYRYAHHSYSALNSINELIENKKR